MVWRVESLNASDIDGLNDGSYYTIFQNPSNGTASIHETDGNWTYSPNQDFSGTETFAVSITDDLNQSYIQIIGIVINEARRCYLHIHQCGSTGRTGPTQSSVNLSYAGTNLENNVLNKYSRNSGVDSACNWKLFHRSTWCKWRRWRK